MNGRLLRTYFSVFVTLVLLSSLIPPAPAQTISGVIAGRVTDPSGAVVENASVVARDKRTGRERSISTNSIGEFRFPEVTPGDYQLIVEKEGFAKATVDNVRVNVNRVTFEEVKLKLPPTTEEVTVSTSPMYDRTGPTIGSNFIDRQIQELPILTRDVNNLALLASGVISARSFSFASTLVPFSVNGSRGRDNNFIIDSVDNNEPLFGGAATQFTNTDIFVEYTILTNQLKAEFGRNSGSTVNVITRSGSNDLHGTLFWFGQHDAFNAVNAVEETAFLSQPTRYYDNQVGMTLGGPIRQNKTFYFISYQWERATSNLSNVYPVIATFPTNTGINQLRAIPQNAGIITMLNTPSLLSVPFSAFPCFSGTPPTGFQSFPCRAPTNVFSGTGTANVQFAPYLVPDANVFNVQDHQFSARIDHRLTDRQDIYGRFLFDDVTSPRFPNARASDSAFNDSGLYPDWQTIVRQRTQSLVLNHRYYWPGGSKLNEFRFSYSRISQGVGPFRMPESITGQAAAIVADNFGGFGTFQPLFSSAGQRFAIGQESSPSQADTNSFQFQENFSTILRRHVIKFGMNFVRIQSDIFNIPSDLGVYLYGDSSAGIPGFADFAREPSSGATRALAAFQRLPNVLSDPNTGLVTGQGSPLLTLREFDQFYFFQDDWRVTDNLTVSFGIRYENYGQPINRVRELNPRGPSIERDDNNFAPRFGFAWSPWDKTVIRGGYALMYNNFVLNIPLRIWQTGRISPFVAGDPTGTRISAAVTSGTFPRDPFVPADLNRLVRGCSSLLDRTTAGTVPLIDCSSEDTVDPKLVNPYVHHFSLGIQQELTKDLLFEVGYVGSKGTKLFMVEARNPYQGWDTTTVNVSPPFPFNCLSPATFDNAGYFCVRPRVENRRGAINTVTNSGISVFHSLQASLTRRMGRLGPVGDVSFSAAYTWGHLIDYASEIFGPSVRLTGGTVAATTFRSFRAQFLDPVPVLAGYAANPNFIRSDRGNSAFDRRHRFVFSYLWSVAPDAKSQIARGWQLGGIFNFQSGAPYSPLNALPFSPCSDYNGDGDATNDRPAIGNPDAPASSIAIISRAANPNCSVRGTLTYVDATGAVIDPSTARFVQVPLGVATGQPFTVGGKTFNAGSAGRNTLVGPRLVNWDVALFKTFSFRDDRFKIQFRWEIYDVLNHRSPGNPLGNVFVTDAQPTPAFAFSPRASVASVTGAFPENAIDARDPLTGNATFRSRQYLNTSSRHMQFGLKLIF